MSRYKTALNIARKRLATTTQKAPKNTPAKSSKVFSAASAPFKASRFSDGSDPRAKVVGLARGEELKMKSKLAKRKAAARSKAPKSGQVKPYNPSKRYGPNTQSEQRVDDLFGV